MEMPSATPVIPYATPAPAGVTVSERGDRLVVLVPARGGTEAGIGAALTSLGALLLMILLLALLIFRGVPALEAPVVVAVLGVTLLTAGAIALKDLRAAWLLLRAKGPPTHIEVSPTRLRIVLSQSVETEHSADLKRSDWPLAEVTDVRLTRMAFSWPGRSEAGVQVWMASGSTETIRIPWPRRTATGPIEDALRRRLTALSGTAPAQWACPPDQAHGLKSRVTASISKAPF